MGLRCGRRCGAEFVAVRLLWVARTEVEWSVVWADILDVQVYLLLVECVCFCFCAGDWDWCGLYIIGSIGVAFLWSAEFRGQRH